MSGGLDGGSPARRRARAARAALARAGTALVLATAFVAVPHPGGGSRSARAAGGPGDRVVFAAAPGASVLVDGRYPVPRDSPCVRRAPARLHERYPGTLEIGREADGRLFVIDTLPFEEYLRGIAEVPPTWPMAALEAQAVAARSYALANLTYPGPTGRRLGYQLCATSACQVYRGLGMQDGPFGARWVRAVAATSGTALLYGGRPADTVYFSTSDGHTYSNAAVFGSAPLPYLRPVIERDDGGSPLAHWRTSLPLADVARFLAAAGAWPRGVPVASVGGGAGGVRVRGGGRETTLAATAFAGDLNAWGPCLDPGRYPTANQRSSPGGGSRLPQTVPSRWFRATTAGGRVVIAGRGWGHGVGMVQWGAEGKAARGWPYRRILAYYYGGLAPRPYPEPATVRIGLAVGLSSVTVVASGRVSVRGAGAPASGPWVLTGGDRLTVRRGPAPAPEIGAGTLAAPSRARPGGQIAVRLNLPQASVVQLELAGRGRAVRVGPPRSLASGPAVARVSLPTVAPGRYALRATVSDGVDFVTTRAVPLELVGSQPPSVPPRRGGGASPLLPALLGVAVLLAVGALAAARRVRASRGR